MPAVELTMSESFAWGCLGGFIAFLVVFALPEVRKALAGGATLNVTLVGLVLVVVLGAMFVSLGGLAAMFIGDATSYKHAMAYGLSFEAIFGAAIRGALPED